MQTDGGLLYSQIENQLPGFVQQNHTQFSKFVEKYYEFLELNLLTFTDLDLNEDSIIQESANTIYTVTVATGNNVYSNSANKFYIDDAVSPTLTLTTGTYAIFDQGDETNDTHYFRISTTPNGIHTAGGLEYVTDDRGDTLVTYEGEPADLDNIILETGTNGGGILLYEDETEIGYEIAPRVIFYVSPDLAGKSLYYYCNNHSGMGGNISVSNVTSYMVLDNGNTDSSNTSTDQVNLENPTRQGDQFLSGEIILGANSGATGVVRGKFSNTQVYLEETNNGSFQTGESIEGLTSRVTATVNNYSRQPLNASRNVKGFQDIDKAPKGFVELFRKEFLDGIPTSILADKDRILKNVKDFYRAKGNEASYQYIFRLLYDKQDVSFYYPSTDILRLSDGRWTLDKSLKIETDQANNITAFLGRTIQGGVTNVFALVERTETYQVGATSITELFLSDIDANNAAYNANTDSNYTTFNVNEKISTTTEDDDGNIGSANTTGVLASVSIDAGGSNYSVGDDLLITGGGGSEAAAKVGAVSDATISSIDIIDSGDGYTVGDTVSFINEGTGGTGGAARVQTIVKTANVFTQTEIINTFKDDLLSASGFTDPWTSFTVNTHISSNSTTTFTVPFDGLSGDTPKSGDFIAKFGSGESITSYTPGGSKFGSVITANSTSITYALGSLNLVRNSLQAHSADPTSNNFTNDDSVTIFDLTKDSSGSAKSANGHNAAFVATGGTFNINGTPTANTDTTYHGAGTFTESSVGGIRSIQVLSSGQGYTSSPVVSVANTEIEAYNAAEYVVGANSTFVNLANSIANTFTSNTIVKNASNSAIGIVLDFIDANTDLVATGNTTLRIQMTTAADFSPADVLTAYNRSDNSPVGIGDFGTANVSSDGVTATFTQADHGFEQGDRIVVSGASGTDTAVYNNNHTIDSVTNTSTYVVTLPSDPTDNDKDSVTVRLINTANVAYERMLTEDSAETQIQLESNGYVIVESGIDESNAIFANTGVPGNNAIIQISQIAIGAIQSVVVSNFGAGFTSTPTINASAKGDGNATLTGNLGALAEYEGYFDGNYGLLSTTNKLQDNYYYQDFSYVIKTDVDVATYRDKIIELVHPAGMALFGEVSMIANTSVRLFNDATNNVETVIANTTHGIDVPLYRHRDIEIMSVNAENVQVNTTSTLMKPNLFPPTANRAIDAKIDTTGASFEFDVQLEHGHDLISLEIAESIFVYENSGEILLEQDIGGGVGDRLIGETSDILVGEDDSLIIQENIEEVGFHIATESRDQFGISFDDGSILLDGVIDSAKDPFFELDGVNDGRTIKGNSRHGIFLEDTDGVILDEVEVGNGDEHRILFGRAVVAGFHIKQEGDLTGGFLILDSTDGAPGTDEGGKIDIDGLVIDGHQIVMEDGTGAIVLDSTDGAPASDENDNIITEDYEYSEGTGADSIITEDFATTVFTDADDGKILLEHADGFIVSENYEDGDDVGVLLEDNSEGRLVSEDASDAVVLLEAQNDVDDRLMLEDGEMLLSENTVEHNTFLLANVITAGGRIQEDGPEGQLILQEDESFTLSEDYEEENDTEDGFRQIRLEDNQFLLSEDQPVPYFQDGHIDTNVEFLEMEKGEAVENVYVELEQSDGNGISVRPEFLTRFVLEEDSTDMVKILDEVSGTDNFQGEEFHASLVQEETDRIQLERSDGIIITEDNDGIQLEAIGSFERSGLSNDEVYSKYGLFSFVQTSVSLNSQDGDVRDLKFNNDGDKVFVLGRGNDGVYEYVLSTPFDVSSLTFVHKLDISGQETAANSLEFNLDGTKLFVLGQSDDNVDEYALSTGFDLSTASFTDSFDINPQEGKPYGLAFNNDGTKMYVSGWAGDDVNEYALTTAFDVSTASFTQRFSTEGTGRSNPSAVQFNADGTLMYVLQGDTNARIQEYSLTTAFDISTASFTEKVFDVTNEENRARGFCFSADHSKLFVVGWRGDDINEYTVNYSLYGQGESYEYDSTTDSTPAFFLFENDDADARGYVLTEPELVSSHIVSENDADTFVIRMEQDGTFFFIRQESELGADFGDFILLEDVGTSDSDYDGSVSTEGRLMGFTNPTSRPDRMSLEKDEYIEDTNLKGEHYEPGTGFFLPKLQFPLAETGASKIDFSFTSNLLIEIDSIDVMTFDGLLVAGGAIELEDHTSGNDDGRAQLLIDSFDGGSLNENDRIVTEDFEMESFGVTGILGDVLQEDGESKILAEVQVDTPEGYIYDLILLEESDGINPMYIALEDSMTEEVDVGTELELLLVDDDHQLHLESGGVLLHENGGIGLEDSVDNVRLESSEGMLLQEDGVSVIVFESGSQDGDNFANVILAEDNSKIFLEDSLNDVVEISEPVKASATVKAGVILTDTGHTLNEGNFQVQGTGRVQLRGAGSFELLDEDGNHLVAEQSSDTFKNFTTESDNPYILEQSSGIDTSFLVSDILVEEAESIRFISASYLRQNDAIGTDTKFESEFSAVIILEAETGVVLLEEGTSQDNLICQENSDDKIFEPIQIEESGTLIGNLAAEDDFQKDTARLVLNDLHDLILEEEAIALEEEDHILQEDFTSGDAIKSLLTEGGDNLVLQHADHNLATEEIIGLDNFVQEDRTIDSFTPLLGLEPDNLSGNGGTMDDQGQIPPNIVLEDGTNKTENLCIVMEDTIINSAGGRIGYEDTDGNEESHVLLEDDTGGKVVTEDFFRVTELGEFVVQEGDGVSKIVQEEFYYKQWSEGQIQQTGTTVTIASGRLPHGIHEGGQLRYANGLHTKITSMGSLNEEFEVENSATISTAQNYRILYGVDDTAYNKEVFVSLELNTLSSSGANDAGRQYQFTPDGIVGHEDLDGLGTFTLTPFLLDQRHGNDIVYEDGERILHEDGELTQDENVILLEVNDVLILEDSTNENHNSLLLETGGEIFLEETNQDSEFKLSMESNDVVMLENPVSSFDFRLLNMDGARFRIGLISNSTFMTVDSTETFFERPDSPIIIERAERIV